MGGGDLKQGDGGAEEKKTSSSKGQSLKSIKISKAKSLGEGGGYLLTL